MHDKNIGGNQYVSDWRGKRESFKWKIRVAERVSLKEKRSFGKMVR
jgi:hypothetical protein